MKSCSTEFSFRMHDCSPPKRAVHTRTHHKPHVSESSQCELSNQSSGRIFDARVIQAGIYKHNPHEKCKAFVPPEISNESAARVFHHRTSQACRRTKPLICWEHPVIHRKLSPMHVKVSTRQKILVPDRSGTRSQGILLVDKRLAPVAAPEAVCDDEVACRIVAFAQQELNCAYRNQRFLRKKQKSSWILTSAVQELSFADTGKPTLPNHPDRASCSGS